jgi:hypothetical protein
VWLEDLGQLKNPVIPFGIEHATFWLVEQFLNQLHYDVATNLCCYTKLIMRMEGNIFLLTSGYF